MKRATTHHPFLAHQEERHGSAPAYPTSCF